MEIKVLQWNIRSFVSNFNDLKILIKELNPDIIALSETFLRSYIDVSLSGYSLLRQDRADGYGGIAFAIRNYIPYVEIDLQAMVLPVGLQISGVQCAGYKIFNLYVPPDVRLSPSVLDHVFSLADRSSLFIGDFNAQNSLWGSGRGNRNGNVLQSFIRDSDFGLLNDGSPTRVVPPGISTSAPDLSICSSDLLVRCAWSVVQDSGSSDHLPIMIMINGGAASAPSTCFSLRKYNTKYADWQKFSKHVFEEFSSIQVDDIDRFVENIQAASDASLPKFNSRQNSKYSVHWWDEEVSEMIKSRRSLLSVYNQSPTLSNYLRYKNQVAKTRAIVKKKKKVSFRGFCENLTIEHTHRFWGIIKKFSGRARPNKIHPVSERCCREILNKLSPPMFCGPLSLQYEPVFEAFSLQELLYALKKRTNSSPGMDGIDFTILFHLPLSTKILLLELFNKLLGGSDPSPMMSSSVIIPLLKGSLPADVASNYRPISISPCTTKILERMLKVRIEKKIEDRVGSFCFGFRRGRSVFDCHSLLTAHVYAGFARGFFSVGVFLDISSAYDNVDLNTLWADMIECGINRNEANLIYRLFLGRKVSIRSGSNVVLNKVVYTGLPQGSVLSAPLFNLYTSFPSNLLDCDVVLFRYADDFAMVSSGGSLDAVIEGVNSSLDKLNLWLGGRNLSINVQKSSAVVFTKHLRPPPHPDISLNFLPIPWKHQIKYLGVTFQQKLKWDAHIDLMCSRAISQCKIIKSLCKPSWGSHPSILLNVYKGLVRPYLDFGGILYGRCSRASLSKLDRVQFAALRSALGLMRSTPTSVILAESGELPLKFRRLWLSFKFVSKLIRLSSHPLSEILRNPEFLDGLWFNGTVPGYVQAFKLLKDKSNDIWRAPCLPFFLSDYRNRSGRVYHLISDLQKGSALNQQKLLCLLSERFQGFTELYTDASRVSQPESVGYGVWIPSSRTRICGKLPDHWSIFSAEMFAVNRSINWILEKNIHRSVIISDSQSVISKLGSGSINANSDIFTVSSIILLDRARSMGFQVSLLWVPSHSNILNNDIADELANRGRQLLGRSGLKGDPRDFWPAYIAEIWGTWDDEYFNIGLTKGKIYAAFVRPSKYRAKPWFRNRSTSRKSITSLTRLRSGHCSIPDHLARIGVVDSPLCSCGEVGNMMHLFLSCDGNRCNVEILYEGLSSLGLSLPINIYEAIFSHREEITSLLLEFLRCSNLHV